MLSDLETHYTAINAEIKSLAYGPAAEYLTGELPHIWIAAYKERCGPRSTCICQITKNGFEYLFDDIDTLEYNGDDTIGPDFESRIVAACGKSVKHERRRDDYRLKGWVGQTEKRFGKGWDKGHFIAHCIGGAVDGLELNVFQQRRDLNRGWSDEGKIYAKMEKHCYENPGTFCFSRPLYTNQTSAPYMLEFGILMPDSTLWVEQFSNHFD